MIVLIFYCFKYVGAYRGHLDEEKVLGDVGDARGLSWGRIGAWGI